MCVCAYLNFLNVAIIRPNANNPVHPYYSHMSELYHSGHEEKNSASIPHTQLHKTKKNLPLSEKIMPLLLKQYAQQRHLGIKNV